MFAQEVKKHMIRGSAKVLPNELNKSPSVLLKTLTSLSHLQNFVKARLELQELMQFKA